MRTAREKTAKGLRGGKRQLVFLSGTLECFRRVLDSINDLVVFLDRYQADDRVVALRSIVLKRPFEIHKLAG